MNEIKLYAAIAGLVAFIVVAIGAYKYGEHQQSNADTVKAQNLQLKLDEAVSEAKAAVASNTAALQASEDMASVNLRNQLAKQKGEFDAALTKSMAALSKLPACPIPIADIGLLNPTPTSPGGGNLSSGASPGPGNNKGGTMDASCVILSCESNQAVFERVSARLANCVARYNEVRAALHN